jgi:hypothetical protein
MKLLVTLRDMLSHRTGLRAYADLAAEPGVLSREEYLKAATSAKPTAKFREKFQYSNAMFTAAGEAIAKANQMTWEGLIESAIGRVRSFFDGTRGGQETTFGQDAAYSGDELERMRRKSASHVILEARKLYSQVVVDRQETLGGDETFVLKLTPKSGPGVSLFVSARTSLILKEQSEGQTAVFGDHRNIDGEVVPFRTTIHDALGEATVEVQEVKFGP